MLNNANISIVCNSFPVKQRVVLPYRCAQVFVHKISFCISCSILHSLVVIDDRFLNVSFMQTKFFIELFLSQCKHYVVTYCKPVFILSLIYCKVESTLCTYKRITLYKNVMIVDSWYFCWNLSEGSCYVLPTFFLKEWVLDPFFQEWIGHSCSISSSRVICVLALSHDLSNHLNCFR